MDLSDLVYSGVYDGGGNRTRVIFGPNALDQLPAAMSSFGKRALLITGNTINTKTDLVQRVQALLGSQLVGVFAESASHTPRSTVLRAASLARDLEPDCLISLGGGGATDVAKAVVLALWLDIREHDDFDRAFQQVRSGSAGADSAHRPLPQISLPTTLVAAEHTNGVGITNDVTHQKQVFLTSAILAAAVVLDPELTKYTPRDLWLSAGVKALDHSFGQLSEPARHPMIDAVETLCVRILSQDLRRSYDHPEDTACRGRLQIGAWLSMFGNGSIPGKRQGFSHSMGRQIGAVCRASHGLIAAVVLPPSIEYNATAAAEGIRIAANALGVADAGMSAEQTAHAAADAIRSLVAYLGLPHRLRDIGVPRDKLPQVADRAMTDMSIGLNPRKITGASEVLAFLEKIW